MVPRFIYSKTRARGGNFKQYTAGLTKINGSKINIFLSAGGDRCNMMYAGDQLAHKIKLYTVKLQWNNAPGVELN